MVYEGKNYRGIYKCCVDCHCVDFPHSFQCTYCKDGDQFREKTELRDNYKMSNEITIETERFKMKCIYIAGKYRDKSPYLMEQNIRKAEALALSIAELGLVAICPHTQSRFLHGTLTEKYWLEATMEMMRRCDAVLVCDNWEDSEGTKGEIEEAVKLGMLIFYDIKKLVEKQNLCVML